MTNWPNIDQYSPVFTTGMPQVDRAETAEERHRKDAEAIVIRSGDGQYQ